MSIRQLFDRDLKRALDEEIQCRGFVVEFHNTYFECDLFRKHIKEILRNDGIVDSMWLNNPDLVCEVVYHDMYSSIQIQMLVGEIVDWVLSLTKEEQEHYIKVNYDA